MTRIIAGTAGGRTLDVPASGTRPTSDRVREALFSRLAHADVLDGATVWDLYAGSGALGLEAASRGAASVVLVEANARAAQVCRRNAERLGLGQVRVAAQRVAAFLERASGPVDVVLVDPPYDLGEDELAAALGAVAPHLAVGSLLVVERTARSPEPTWPPGVGRTGEKRYGETVLWYAEPLPTGAPGPAAPTVAG